MQKKRVEKRLPFGFIGDWGFVYTLYTDIETAVIDGTNIVEFEKKAYVDIGMKRQLRERQRKR